jgi:hypothetical protein
MSIRTVLRELLLLQIPCYLMVCLWHSITNYLSTHDRPALKWTTGHDLLKIYFKMDFKAKKVYNQAHVQLTLMLS